MKKMVIIDDDKIVTGIYRHKFQIEGFEVETAYDGEEGLALVERFRPDILLTDLQLPKLDGVGVIIKLRNKPEFRALPIIVISNAFQSRMLEAAWKAGATRCLTKASCTPKAVCEIITGVLNTHIAAAATVPTQLSPAVINSAPSSRPHDSSPSTLDSKPETLEQWRIECLKYREPLLEETRRVFQELLKTTDPAARKERFFIIQERMRSFSKFAGALGYFHEAQIASVLEALANELVVDPKRITPSALQTAAQALDTLIDLTRHEIRHEIRSEEIPPNILVVDDDSTCRQLVNIALRRIGLNSIQCDSGEAALPLLQLNNFDIIFLDVNMGGINGFQLCEKIRDQSHHKKTPVIFVTRESEFAAKAKSALSGGTDLIAKPFLMIELTTKTLIHLTRRHQRIQGETGETA